MKKTIIWIFGIIMLMQLVSADLSTYQKTLLEYCDFNTTTNVFLRDTFSYDDNPPSLVINKTEIGGFTYRITTGDYKIQNQQLINKEPTNANIIMGAFQPDSSAISISGYNNDSYIIYFELNSTNASEATPEIWVDDGQSLNEGWHIRLNTTNSSEADIFYSNGLQFNNSNFDYPFDNQTKWFMIVANDTNRTYDIWFNGTKIVTFANYTHNNFKNMSRITISSPKNNSNGKSTNRWDNFLGVNGTNCQRFSHINSIEFNNESIETSINQIKISLKIYNSTKFNYSFLRINLIYNNSVLNATNIINDTFLSNFSFNNVPIYFLENKINNTNLSFYFNFSLSNSLYNSSNYNQTVHRIHLNNCTTPTTNKTINISVFDENQTNLYLNSNIDALFVTWLSNYSLHRNYSFSFRGATNYSICIYPTWANYTVDSIFSYVSDGYTPRYYYLNNHQVNNITQVIPLYLLQTGALTRIYITLNDLEGNTIRGAYIKVMRKDIAANTFNTIEIIKTNDVGIATTTVIPYTQIYKFLVEYNEQIVYISEEDTIKQSDITFNIDLSASSGWLSLFKKVNNVQGAVGWNNNTLTFTYVFSDVTGTVSQGCLETKKVSANDESVLSNQCVNSSASSLSYTVSATSGTFKARGYFKDSIGDDYTIAQRTAIISTSKAIFGNYGLFLSIILIGTLSSLGFYRTWVGLSGAALGWVIVSVFGLITIKYSTIITILIIFGIVIWKQR